MTVIATGKSVDDESISFNTTNSLEADFQGLCTGVTLHSTEDVHIAFDTAANSGSWLLKADVMIDIPDIKFTRVSALGASTTGTLYILARR